MFTKKVNIALFGGGKGKLQLGNAKLKDLINVRV